VTRPHVRKIRQEFAKTFLYVDVFPDQIALRLLLFFSR
jgi:hypothetical protein